MYICRGLHTGHLRQQQQQRQRQMRRFDKALPLVAVTVVCLLLAVLGRAAMCLNRTESRTLLRDAAADPANPAPSPRASQIHPPLAPRVALLFLLSQPQLPTEPAWTAFFEAAARLPRPQTRQRGGTVTVATAAAAAAAAAAASWLLLWKMEVESESASGAGMSPFFTSEKKSSTDVLRGMPAEW